MVKVKYKNINCIILLFILSIFSMSLRGELASDINKDGNVNFIDLAYVANDWLGGNSEEPNRPCDPVIVHDWFNKSRYHIFVPADEKGKHWSRWTIGWPNTNHSKLYPVREAFYGIVRPGKAQTWNQSSNSSGYWTGMEIEGWDYGFCQGIDNWIEWEIPDGHNRIHMIVYWIEEDSADLSLSINGGTYGLNRIVLYPYWFDSGYEEIVVARDLTGTNNILRATLSTISGAARIIGIHSFDDDEVGQPGIIQEGKAIGHDLVDLYGYDYGRWLALEEIYEHSLKFWQANTVEFTIKWKPVGFEESKWTAFGAHFGGTNADFTVFEAADFYLNGSYLGKLDDDVNFPAGTAFTGEYISLHTNGYGDYNRNGNMDSEDALRAEIKQNFTKAGASFPCLINWQSNANVGVLYSPSLSLTYRLNGDVYLPPEKKKYAIGTDYSGLVSNRVYIVPDDFNVMIDAGTTTIVSDIFENTDVLGPNKIYFQLNHSLFQGGEYPLSGDIWNISSYINIRKEEMCNF